jgi:short-subunit dehydrogenase
VIVADLSEPDGRGAVEERLRRGDIELLVNNAGFGTVGEYASLPLDRETQEIELNIVALARLTHIALEAMVPQGRGGIINVASTAAFQPIPYNATYAATKAFVLHFSEAVHEEAKRHGVTVTCLCPGPVRTEFQEVAGIPPDRMRAVPWVEVDHVVDAALGALRSGRAICIPGVGNKLLASTVRFTPRFVTRRISGSMFRNIAGG